jgi:hypothetical protein
VIRIDDYDESVVRFYCIKSVDIDKIVFDVYAIEDCNMQNDLDSNKVMVLGESIGTVKLKAVMQIIKLAVNAVGCVVFNLDMDTDNKKVVLINMDFANEIEMDNSGGN